MISRGLKKTSGSRWINKDGVQNVINPLSTNPAVADEMFERVWPFCGVGT